MAHVPDLATKPTINGHLVTLRPFRDGDTEVMVEVLSDPEVRRLTGSVESTAQAQRPQPLDDRLRDWYATRNDQPDRLDLAVEDRERHPRGRGGAQRARPRVADLQPAGAGRPAGARPGLGTDAVGLVTAYGLEALGLRRITLEVFEFNPRGRRVYEKVGYVVTGVRAGALLFDGVAVAAVDMAVDAESWRLSRDPQP